MADIFSKKVRSKIMASIKSSHTSPESQVRDILKKLGIKYSRHSKSIPGSPDFALHKKKIAIFVHGCFWHLHGCHISHIPQSRKKFWTAKLERNVRRDKKVYRQLKRLGWKTLIIWECSLKTKSRITEDMLSSKMIKFFNASTRKLQIKGKRVSEQS